MLRGWGYLTVLCECSTLLSTLPARLKVSGEHRFFPLPKSLDYTCEHEPLAECCLLPDDCWVYIHWLLPLVLLTSWQPVPACFWVQAKSFHNRCLIPKWCYPLLAGCRAPLWGDGERENCPLFSAGTLSPLELQAGLVLSSPSGCITSGMGCCCMISPHSPHLMLSPALSCGCCVLCPCSCCISETSA